MQTPLDHVEELYRSSLYLQALEASRVLGPPQTWKGPRGRIMAGRLVSRLGAMRLGDALMWRAFREFPEDWEVRYYRVWRIASRKGPLAAIRFLESFKGLETAPQTLQGDWVAAAARQYANLRDFDTAHADIVHAMRLAPNRAWLWVERSGVLAAMDRREEALDAANEALRLRPLYESAIQQKVELLGELNRDDEALELLLHCAEKLESGNILWHAALLLTEAERFAEARDLYEKCLAYFPLSDKRHRMWLDARRSDTAYRCGDLAAARELAAGVRGRFYETLCENLAQAPADARRVELAVPFVRQHHVTCAPATLTSLCGYWNVPANHVELAEKICYDGTPSHSERHWAQQQGFVVREFTLDWDSATALLDRAIPFAVETRYPTSAHIQPIIGYDARRGTLLTRDPGQRLASEMMAAPLLEQMAAFGPRAMAIIPAGAAEKIAGLTLPDAELFDDLYTMQRALLKHDRAQAARIVEQIAGQAPEHRLALHARRTLAQYDGDDVSALACVDAQLAKYPDNHIVILSRLSVLGNLGRFAERLQGLEAICDRLDCPPVFWRDLGRELSADHRRLAEARGWLTRAVRYLPTDAYAYYSLAGVDWDLENRDEAMRLYRIAACLDDKDEQYARSYFIASRHLKRVEESLTWLRRRYASYGHKSSGPAITLVNALLELDRTPEALDLLDEAVARRADDGALLTYAATRNALAERWDVADARLAAARGVAHRGAWLRAAARCAELRGEFDAALQHWRDLAELDPLDAVTHETICDLLRTTADEHQAIEYLRSVATRHPHHLHIQQAFLRALRVGDTEEAIQVARRAAELHPADAWTRRELAEALGKSGRVEEALEQADIAVAIESTTPSSYGFRGSLLAGLGRIPEAREDFRRALRLSADYQYAFESLYETCDTDDQRRVELNWFHGELARQTTFGDGLLSYYRYARELIDPEELLATLRVALNARRDLWQAWTVVTAQLRRMNRLEEARQFAEQTTKRFPLMPKPWLDLALVYADLKDGPRRIEALQKAIALNPGWGSAAQELAEAQEEAGDLAAAEQTLVNLLRRSPQETYCRGALADLLRRLDRHDQAFEELLRACRIAPSYGWGWATARKWFGEANRIGELCEVAREVTARRPGDAFAWYRLAECLDPNSAGESGLTVEAARQEALDALDRAIRLDPSFVDAHAERAYLLFEADRLDEALAATRPVAWTGVRPVWLRTWEARILAKLGRTDDALDRYRIVTKDAPQYLWAWELYLELLAANERHQQCRSAAEEAVEHNPEFVVGLGYLGDACWALENLAAAQKAYERSIAVSSQYSYGARQLVRLHLQTENAKAAATALATYRERDLSPWSLQLGVRVDVLCNGVGARLDDFSRLVECQDASSELLHDVATYLKSTRLRRAAERMARAAVGNMNSNPHIGAAWAILAGPSWLAVYRLTSMTQPTPAWQSAVRQMSTELISVNARWKFRCLFLELRNRVRDDDDTWSQFGYALNCFGRHRASWNWMRDWRKHESAEPWALFNALQGAWRFRRYEEARSIGETALALPPDHSRPLQLVWHAALVLLFDRNHDRAAELLAQADRSKCTRSHAAILNIIEPCIQALSSPPPQDRRERKLLLRTQRKAVARYRRTMGRDPVVRQIAFRCLKLVAEHLGRNWLANWYDLRRYL